MDITIVFAASNQINYSSIQLYIDKKKAPVHHNDERAL